MGRRSSLLKRIIAVLFGVIVLPVLAILLFYYPQSREILGGVVEAETVDEARRTVQRLDAEFDKIYASALDLQNNLLLWNLDAKDTYRYYQTVRKRLSAAAAQSELVERAVLINPGQDIVYTSEGTLDQSYFADRLYRFSDRTQEEFFQQISGAERPFIGYTGGLSYTLTTTVVQEYLYLCFPVAGKTDRILFFIPVDQLRRLLRSVSSAERNYLVYCDSGILVSQETDIGREEMWRIVQNLSKSGSAPGYTTCSQEGKYFGIRYRAFLREDLLYADLRQLQLVTLLLLGGIVLAGTSGMLILVRGNYRPIVAILRSLDGEVPISREQSEFSAIQDAIRYMKSSNENLNTELRSYQENYQCTFLYELLSGNVNNVNALADLEERLDMELYGRSLVPAFLRYRSAVAEPRIFEAVETLNRLFRGQREPQLIFSACAEKNALFLLTSCEVPCGDRLRAFLRDQLLPLELFQEGGGAQALLGSACEDIYEIREDVWLLFRLLDSAAEDPEPVLAAEDGGLAGAGEGFPVGIIYDLTHAVDRMELEGIHDRVERICRIILSRSTPLTVSKLLYSQAAYILSSVSGKETQGVYERSSVSQLVGQLWDLEQSVRRLAERQEVEVAGHKRDILTYIAEHYLDPDFSITTLADHYRMQVSNMSAYFKKKYGVTFQQYVSQMKVEKAKELLADVNLGLEEISERLGYASASSFGRTFKRLQKMTPGEFRASIGG